MSEPGDLVDNVFGPRPFGRPSYLGVKLMKCVIHWRNSYPENVGHGQRFVALEVLLGKVSARLRKEPTNTFGKSAPHSRQYQSRLGFGPRDRECLERSQATSRGLRPTAPCQDSRANHLSRDVRGSSGPLLGSAQESESNRKRWSVSQETREARLSKAVTKHLPTRQPSGGAPVVVRDVNDVRKAKGCRMIRVRMTEVFFNLEASK
jgi:hypothetical protein